MSPRQSDLLGGDGRRKPPTKYSDAQRLTGEYIKHYEQKFNERPNIEARDGKTFKELIAQHGVEKVSQRLADYFAWDDGFVVDSGYSVGLFRTTWNRLTAYLQKHGKRETTSAPADCRHAPRCKTAAEHTKRYFADMKRGT